jgi:aminoglycoside 6'-N-acetyltransferase
VLLRPVADDDFAVLVSQIAHPDVERWWGPHSEADLRDALAAPGRQIVSMWTIVLNDAIAGLMQATEEPEPNYRYVELDLFVEASRHGQGLGGEAIRVVLRHMFEQRGHHRAIIMPAVENERAIRSYERVGFKPVGVMRKADRGVDGRWRDSLVMDMLADELR